MSDPADRRDDRAHWDSRYASSDDDADLRRAPSPWVLERCLALPPRAPIVDLAGGVGRHAEPLARAGRTVILVDFIARAVAAGVARGSSVLGLVADTRALPFRAASLDAIVCVSFLDRALFPVLATLLRPGGVLVYETFTLEHLELVASGRVRGPRNAAYLLAPGELPRLVAPLVVREAQEGRVIDAAGERHVARVVAVRGRESGIGNRGCPPKAGD